MVTASTLQKRAFFNNDKKICILQDTLFDVMDAYGWRLQAWAVFSNHYHFIAKASDEERALKKIIQRMHSQSSRKLNEMDGSKRRRIWFQYWDTALTFEKSYYARLNYVHNNAVKHGIVQVAQNYPYCSATWFIANSEPAFRKKVESFGYERVKVIDDF